MNNILVTQRIEKHIIKSSNSYYKMLDDFCFKSKNLYNSANYIVRQEFIKNNNYIGYYKLDPIMRNIESLEGKNDYRNMPSSETAQQCLILLDKNWKAFFKSIKDWKSHPEKYKAMPKLPKYKKKDGRNVLICYATFKEEYIKFPKSFKGFMLKTKVPKAKYVQVRFIPKNNQIVAEVIYNKEIPDYLEDNNRYISCDLGVNNLIAMTNNCGLNFKLINGRKLKSVNQYYNKKTAYYKELAMRMNDKYSTNRLKKVQSKRNNIIDDLIHKASRKVIEYALSCEANTIVIGLNKDWKYKVDISRIQNQHFVEIPYKSLINKIIYKAEEQGIKVITTEESYTSGTSFLDNELPIKENYNINRRIKRGLFKSTRGLINSDINGSLQILKKVFPEAYDGIEGCAFNPVKVNL